MENVKIGFVGTHGTGKTTSVYEMATALKKVAGLPNVGILVETARGCPYPINRETGVLSQEWLTINQTLSEHNMARSSPILVCDRTVLDAMAYTLYAGLDKLYHALLPYARHHAKSYRMLFLKPAEGNSFHADDGFRDQDEEFRSGIDRIMVDRIIPDVLVEPKNYPHIMRSTDPTSVQRGIDRATNLCRAIYLSI